MKQFQLHGWKYRMEASFLEIHSEYTIDFNSELKTHEIRMVKDQDLYFSNFQK